MKKEFDELRKCAYKPHLVDGLKNESSTDLKTEEERETSRSASLKKEALGDRDLEDAKASVKTFRGTSL